MLDQFWFKPKVQLNVFSNQLLQPRIDSLFNFCNLGLIFGWSSRKTSHHSVYNNIFWRNEEKLWERYCTLLLLPTIFARQLYLLFMLCTSEHIDCMLVSIDRPHGQEIVFSKKNWKMNSNEGKWIQIKYFQIIRWGDGQTRSSTKHSTLFLHPAGWSLLLLSAHSLFGCVAHQPMHSSTVVWDLSWHCLMNQ